MSSRGGELSRQVGRNRGLRKDSSAQRRRQDGKHEFHVCCVRGPNLEAPLDMALHCLDPVLRFLPGVAGLSGSLALALNRLQLHL